MPAVTVLMPVYNGAPYVKDALESVLAQTFTDFELLLIDDGSTDNTAEIISAYSDSRIRILANPGNLGLVATLNRGLQVAAGAYVAIMHADDICLPERLELQTAYLDIHPEVAMVAAWADFVSASGMPLEPWSEDRIALTPQQIRETLPHTNCIVHPTAMLRTDIARRYLYNGRQHAAEDYDLWLRLSADKLKIGKIDRVLLKYRVHGNSITARSKETLGEYKEIRAKAIFLADSLQHPFRFGALHIYVLRSMVQDFLRVSTNRVKVRFLALARAIFIALGKPFGMFCQKLGLMHHGLLMFISFPLNKVGGAERVHKEIVSCNLQKTPWVVLANESFTENALSRYENGYRFSNISHLIRNPFMKNLAIGFFAGYLNSSKAVVFGGNNEFFYWLVPHLAADVFCVDFVHGFGCEIEFISLPHVSRINRRIVIAEQIRNALVSLYRDQEIPCQFDTRIVMIPYGVDVPLTYPEREFSSRVKVLYVGRGTEEKRVHLVGRIASELIRRAVSAEISLVGDVWHSIACKDRIYCNFIGEIHDRQKLTTLYRIADVLLITSRTEGLCLVNIEAMAQGTVPVAVAVGGIPDHIEDGVTGFLVDPLLSDDEIVFKFCGIIEKLASDRRELGKISFNTYSFAAAHFNRAATLDYFTRMFDCDPARAGRTLC